MADHFEFQDYGWHVVILNNPVRQPKKLDQIIMFWKLPAGAKNIKVLAAGACYAHWVTASVFKTDGTMLVGAPIADKWATLFSDTTWLFTGPYPFATTDSIDVKLTKYLQSYKPEVFDSTFQFDDSKTNGTGLPVAKLDPLGDTNALQTFRVEGQEIRWTGCYQLGTKAYGAVPGDAAYLRETYDEKPVFSHPGFDAHGKLAQYPDYYCYRELIEIDQAQTDLIVGGISNHTGYYEVSWDDGTLPPEPSPEVTTYICCDRPRGYRIRKHRAESGDTIRV